MKRLVVTRLGAQDALALTRRGGSGKHADRRTRRLRTRAAQKAAALREAGR